MTGRIHSIETFGTVDGPGVRFVVFFQGCPMRCLYCHNPDTWAAGAGTEYRVEPLLARMTRNLPFYESGGLTATGGEPLLQLDFLTELFEAAKKEGIHTCLDTSGAVYRPGDGAYAARIDRLLAVTALVMLDIKHAATERHRALTGHGNEATLAFARHLESRSVPMRVRYVLLPGHTDDEASLDALGALVRSFSNLTDVEVLPYHLLGKAKYENLGIPYPLEGIPAATQAQASAARARILGMGE